MQTQTHILLALALFAKKDAPKRNLAIFAGALIPDAFIFVAWAYYSLAGNAQSHIWDVLYFQNPVQFWDALFNSIPIFLTIVVLGWLAARKQRFKSAGVLACVFGLAALIHFATDLPVHASDAHRHFWPISDWRFFSPLSYWEAQHHAMWVNVVEAVLGIGVTTLLLRRFEGKWTKIVLKLLIVLYTLILLGILYSFLT